VTRDPSNRHPMHVRSTQVGMLLQAHMVARIVPWRYRDRGQGEGPYSAADACVVLQPMHTSEKLLLPALNCRQSLLRACGLQRLQTCVTRVTCCCLSNADIDTDEHSHACFAAWSMLWLGIDSQSCLPRTSGVLLHLLLKYQASTACCCAVLLSTQAVAPPRPQKMRVARTLPPRSADECSSCGYADTLLLVASVLAVCWMHSWAQPGQTSWLASHEQVTPCSPERLVLILLRDRAIRFSCVPGLCHARCQTAADWAIW
jgi:hypothetical protein